MRTNAGSSGLSDSDRLLPAPSRRGTGPNVALADANFPERASCASSGLSDELTAITAERGDIFRVFIETRLARYSDLLGVGEVAEATGYCANHINSLCRRGSIEAFLIRSKYLIPKVTLIDYLAQPAIYRRYSKAETAPTLARDFLLEYHNNAEKDSGNQL